MSNLVGNHEDRFSCHSAQMIFIDDKTCPEGFSIGWILNPLLSHRISKRLEIRGRLARWLASLTTDQGVPGSRPGRGTICCGLEQVTITHCLVLIRPRKPWTDD